jgi:hypothetical protein
MPALAARGLGLRVCVLKRCSAESTTLLLLDEARAKQALVGRVFVREDLDEGGAVPLRRCLVRIGDRDREGAARHAIRTEIGLREMLKRP